MYKQNYRVPAKTKQFICLHWAPLTVRFVFVRLLEAFPPLTPRVCPCARVKISANRLTMLSVRAPHIYYIYTHYTQQETTTSGQNTTTLTMVDYNDNHPLGVRRSRCQTMPRPPFHNTHINTVVWCFSSRRTREMHF